MHSRLLFLIIVVINWLHLSTYVASINIKIHERRPKRVSRRQKKMIEGLTRLNKEN